MNIANVPYLNSVAFFRHLALSRGDQLVDVVPRQAAAAAAGGKIAAGLLPVVEFFRLESTFERLGHFGIATRGRAHSAILFARTPLRYLDGARIAVTDHTSTTACLLRLLLEQRYAVTPAAYERVVTTDPSTRATAFPQPGSGQAGRGLVLRQAQDSSRARRSQVEGLAQNSAPPAEPVGLQTGTARRAAWQAADAVLLIGDEALRFKQTNRSFPYEFDLGFEWWLWHHLPCVFAVWAIRQDAASQKKALELALARSLSLTTAEFDSIAQAYAPAHGTVDELKVYLSSFVYRFGADEEAAIRTFRELVESHGLLEPAQPTLASVQPCG